MKNDGDSRSNLMVRAVVALSAVLALLGVLGSGNQSNALGFAGPAALFGAWILLLIVLWYLKRSQEMREQQMRDEFALELQAAREESYTAGFRGLARKFVLESDILSLIQTYMTTSSANAEPNGLKAARLLELLLREFRRFVDLQPIAVDTLVLFDPKQHRTREQLHLGEPAIVVEPGWLLASEMIKMPIVQRRHQKI